MKTHKKKLMSRFKMGFALIALVLGMFALSSFMDSAESIVTGVSIASILPMGIMRDTPTAAELTAAETAIFTKISEKVDKETAVAFGKLIEASEDFKSLKSLIEKMKTATTDADIVKIKAQIEEIGLEIKKAQEKVVIGKGEAVSFEKALKLAFENEKIAPQLKAMAETGKGRLRLDVKLAGTMSVESTIGSGATQVTITEDTGIICPIRKRELTYRACVSVGRIGTNRAVWIEETDEEGTPIMIGEGDSKTQLDVQYVEQTKAVKKIAVYGKVTTELMADIPQLISYIQNNLMKRMDIVLEDQLFNGDGIGDNLSGMIGYATAFDAGALADTIVDANELDVVEAVALQVKLAFGMPECLFIHPSTMSKMKLIKDDAGRPVWKDYITIDGSLNISGLKLVETTAITAGVFVGGETSVMHLLDREDLGIQIGLDGNDFTQNKKTMLLEKRMVQFACANDTGALVTGTFAQAIIDLDTVLT